MRRRPVDPGSAPAAAWGDPAVVLVCGAPPPQPLEPPFAINGVVFTTRDVGAATRWTTYGRTVAASVTVPDAYDGADVMLTLAAPLDRALPRDPAAPDVIDLGTPAPTPEPTS